MTLTHSARENARNHQTMPPAGRAGVEPHVACCAWTRTTAQVTSVRGILLGCRAFHSLMTGSTRQRTYAPQRTASRTRAAAEMKALLAPALSSRRVHMAGTPCRGRLGPVVVKGRSGTSCASSVWVRKGTPVFCTVLA
jgi:hypothetical protein